MDKKPKLILFKYDLLKFEETKVDDAYSITEEEFQMNTIFSEKFG